MTRDARIGSQLPGARGRLPVAKEIDGIRSRIDRCKVCPTLDRPGADGAVPRRPHCVVEHDTCRAVVVTVIGADRGNGYARAEIRLYQRQQCSGVTVCRVRSQRELQRCFRVGLTTLPTQNLRESRKRLGIGRIGHKHLSPGALASLQVASPPNHARQSLSRVRIAGSRQLCVHRLGLPELTVPRECARIVDRSITVIWTRRCPLLVSGK